MERRAKQTSAGRNCGLPTQNTVFMRVSAEGAEAERSFLPLKTGVHAGGILGGRPVPVLF